MAPQEFLLIFDKELMQSRILWFSWKMAWVCADPIIHRDRKCVVRRNTRFKWFFGFFFVLIVFLGKGDICALSIRAAIKKSRRHAGFFFFFGFFFFRQSVLFFLNVIFLLLLCGFNSVLTFDKGNETRARTTNTKQKQKEEEK